MPYSSLKNYGVVGNQNSAAIVNARGSVDWLCLPYLDSPSHFAALLDENQGGVFSIAPMQDFDSEQRYIESSNVLETRFETTNGKGRILDWMPIGDSHEKESAMCRRIETTEGEIEWQLICQPRFSYGSEASIAEIHQGGILFRGNQANDLGFLRGDQPLEITSGGQQARTRFRLLAGQSAQFRWSWGRHGTTPPVIATDRTLKLWQSFAHHCDSSQCVFSGPWHDEVTRSGLLIRLMTADFSGAIAESVTTSLPSLTGGTRNWDYRYAWIRNVPAALQALVGLGHESEAKALFAWLSDVIIRDGAEALQSVYTLDGGKYLPERELPFLAGYAGSRPVRIGNLSARQFHLDAFGHVMIAAEYYRRLYDELPPGLWPRLAEIAEYICQAWRRPDRGHWESRAKPEHFVTSKVMCWAALDHACILAEALGVPIPSRWVNERDILHRTICDQGYDDSRRSFVRAFGDREIDSSVLLIPLVGFLPIDDERIQSTLSSVQAELAEGVLIYPSRASESSPEFDGAHLLSSFWFVSCLAASGRIDEATDALAELCSFATPLGIFAEQIDPGTGEPGGNFPSASAHLALINASLEIGIARGRRLEGGRALLNRERKMAKPLKAA